MLVSPADREVTGGVENVLIERLEGVLELALKALRQKRNFLAELQAEPSMPLYRVAAGARPLIAGSGGVDLITLCGVSTAAARLAHSPEEAAKIAGRLRSYAGVRIAEVGRTMRLKPLLAPDRDGEGLHRFSCAPDVDVISPLGLQLSQDLSSEVEITREPVEEAIQLRFPREHAPAPETLAELVTQYAADGRTRRLRLQPWPDRAIRSPADQL